MLEMLNRYVHGFVAIPISRACHKKGLFEVLKKEGPLSLDILSTRLKANKGYLQIALRMFESLGWLKKNESNQYALDDFVEADTVLKKLPSSLFKLYDASPDILLNKRAFKKNLFESLTFLMRWTGCADSRLVDLIQGVVVVPLCIALKKMHEKEVSLKDVKKIDQPIIDFLIHQKWIESNRQFTTVGQFLWSRAWNMAVAASYAPLLSQIETVLFGKAEKVFQKNKAGHEQHIDRTLNVLGSGFQHTRYFEEVEDVILSVFNKKPYHDQPKYIVDTGCGDGTFLKIIYDMVCSKTARGTVLKEFPLYLIGVDFNAKSLAATKNTLQHIPHRVIEGDVTDPEKMIQDLKSEGIHDIENALHIRSFLDHDRPYVPPHSLYQAEERAALKYQGVFIDAVGRAIPPAEMVQNLVEHLSRWASILSFSRHGLLVLEVHCLTPAMIKMYFDENESFHFDALQALTRQYLVEADVFLMAAAEAGLFPRVEMSRRYPRTFPYTRISLHFFEKKPYTLHYAKLHDVSALCRLEKKCWPEKLCISSEEIKRRLIQFPEGQLVVKKDHHIIAVIYTQKIKDSDRLKTTAFKDVLSLHDAAGDILQLLSISVSPDNPDSGLGDQLMDFVFWRVSLIGGIQKIVGVTRCKNYVDHAHLSLEAYIEAHRETPTGIDPILRFHTNRGAEIKAILPHYRPEDSDNQGAGILIEYAFDKPLKKLHAQSVNKTEQKRDEIAERICQCVKELMPEKFRSHFSVEHSLKDMGFDSLRLLEIRALFSQAFSIKLQPTFFFEYSTPAALIAYFSEKVQTAPHATALLEENSSADEDVSGDPIVIVGMACRFPGIKNPEQFWETLKEGNSVITTVPGDRQAILEDSIKYGGFLESVDCFDAHFFRISPREAELMDPQQRLLLEVSYEALEEAGIPADTLKGSKTGVFVGIFSHDYESLITKSAESKEINAHFATGNSTSIAAGRLSYVLGLQGPAMAINTACSSSLVAVHLACQSLYLDECELALAAGVNLILSSELNKAFTQAGMLSPDGKCKAFDAAADGYVRSEGCGVLVLKKRSKAIADHDTILAVIRGSSVNQDGASNGLTAPNPLSQEALLYHALHVAAVDPASVTYIETHGTGTALGDPVEIQAIHAVYGAAHDVRFPLLVGSVKTNIGHTEAAAGIAGVIKTLLMLRHKKIPPHLHFTRLNPYIEQADFLKIPTELTAWECEKGRMRRAGVSSFAFSGTNAHVILEEAPEETRPPFWATKTPFLITVSAKTDDALKKRLFDLEEWIEQHKEKISLQEISYTLNKGRAHFEKRCALIVRDFSELQVALREIHSKGVSFYQESPNTLSALAECYLKGEQIDWERLHAEEPQRKIRLPTYPFAKERYWIAEKKERVLTKTVSADDFYLRDHNVQGSRVLPGVMYLEMMRASGSRLSSEKSIVKLSDIVWSLPLIVKDATQETLTIQYEEKENEIDFSIKKEAVLHARGKLHYAEKEINAQEQINVSHIPLRLPNSLMQEAIYAQFELESLHYGESFRLLTRCEWGPSEALGEIHLSPSMRALSSEWQWNPGFLEGALQTVLRLAGVRDERPKTRFPFSVGAIHVFSLPPPKVAYAYVQAMGNDVFQVRLTDEKGWVFLKMQEVCVKPQTVKQEGDHPVRLFYPVWQEQRLESDLSTPVSRFLLLILPSAFSKYQKIIEQVYDHSKIKTLVLKNERGSIENFWNEQLKELDLIDEVFFVGGNASQLSEKDRFGTESVFDLFYLIKALKKSHRWKSLKYFTLVTVDAYQVQSEDRLLPDSAGLLGFSHVLAQEYPALSVRTFDLSSKDILAGSFEGAEALLKEPPHKRAECVAYRNAKRYVRTLLPIQLPAPSSSLFRKQGVYLIVGGGGGIGFALSEHLAREYQARLVWVSRGPETRYHEKISHLHSVGGDVFYCQADVNDFSAMQKAVQAAKAKWGMIHGVFHSALVLKDKSILNMSGSEFEAAVSVKMNGSLILYDVLKNEPLDFMLFFSSMLSFMGSIGQCNYLAGCTFQDALANYLHSVSPFPVKVINWGYWGSVGIVSSKEYHQRFHAQEIYSIEPREGISALLRLLDSSLSQGVVVKASDNALVRLHVDLTKEQKPADLSAPSVIQAISDDLKKNSMAFPEAVDEEALNSWSALCVLYAFHNLGVFHREGEIYPREMLRDRLKVLPKYHALFSLLLDILARHGYLTLEEKTIQCRAIQSVSRDELEKQKNVIASRYPALQKQLDLLWICLMAYPEVLTGKRSHMEVMFPDGSFSLVEGIYQGNAVSDYYNQCVAESIFAVIKKRIEWDPETEITLLEIGAGTGGTTRAVLEKLKSLNARFRLFYTDISIGFLKYAEKMWSKTIPGIRFHKLDIEQEPLQQGFSPNCVDVVYASNVLHATKNIKSTLMHVKQLLKERGILILNEMVNRSDFLTLTFGLTEGWWLFEDDRRLPGSPLLSEEGWHRVLLECGYLSVDRASAGGQGQAVLLSESDGWSVVSKAPSKTAALKQEVPVEKEEDVYVYLKGVFSNVLKMNASLMENHQPFGNYGVDSLVTLEIISELSKTVGPLPPTLLFEYVTFDQLADYFMKHHRGKWIHKKTPSFISSSSLSSDKEIAIIGCAGRYPGANHLAELWELLAYGKEVVTEIPKDRWKWEDYFDSKKGVPGKSYSKWGAFLQDVDQFDASFFNISPIEAERMDPQERLFLELASTVLEESGYTTQRIEKIDHKIGVFAGVMNHDYSLYSVRSAYWSIANRVSYYFGLKGPSLAVDTACSSSLTALHLACQSIRLGECEMALAGGVNLILHPNHAIDLCQLQMLSQGNACRAFGDNADGFVMGEGAGILLLKPLQKAILENDLIYGVIKGTAVNAGGRTSGYTVPNPAAQAAVIQAAIQNAEISPDTISYIEAHGTGTALGDPVEIAGLNTVFNRETRKERCVLGSLKSNMGHLESAAGIAGVTKVLLQMQHKKYVPSLHAEVLNPLIDFVKTPFVVSRELAEWPSSPNHLRRAAVSSFGAGGSNAHLILEEAPLRRKTPPSVFKPYYLLTFSAKTKEALLERLTAFAAWLKNSAQDATLEEISYTLNAHRNHFVEWRCALVARSKEEVIDQLSFVHKKEFSESVRWNREKNKLHTPSTYTDISVTPEMSADHVRKALFLLAEIYIKGFFLDWERLHHGEANRRIFLPAAPFMRERFWVAQGKHDAHLALSSQEEKPKEKEPITQSQMTRDLLEKMAVLLKIKKENLETDRLFSEYGLNSLHFASLAQHISEKYHLAFTPALLFEHKTIESVSHFLAETLLLNTPPHLKAPVYSQEGVKTTEDIAVIGMSGRFPGARNLAEFWENLVKGKNAIRDIPKDRWDWQAYYGDPHEAPHQTRVKWGGFIEDIDQFDAAFFNMSPREAALADPQQRLFLQTVWETIEDAGYASETLSTVKTGVFVGAVNDDYSEILKKNNMTEAYVATGTTRAMIANRVSYALNLQGPSVVVDTACSSALVAIHQAIQAIHNGDCAMAIAGGVNALLTPTLYLSASKAMMLSEEGACKTFDKDANGYVRAEGVAAVLLKPLSQAQKDGDTIYGVIKATAVNHGGHVSSLTVPNPHAQTEVICSAHKKAGVAAHTITFVETHGTGTVIGDPIEINGLKKAFSQVTDHPYCGLGSVKTHIGHLESAAGMASLMKVLLSMRHEKIPGNLHLNALNPSIELDHSPFYIVQKTIPWERLRDEKGEKIPLRAGVSAFGFGGVNAHLIVEEPPVRETTRQEDEKPYYLVTLSAKQETSLRKKIEEMAHWLKQRENDSLSIDALSYTLNRGRNHFKYRSAFIVKSVSHLRDLLQAVSDNQEPEGFMINSGVLPNVRGPLFDEIYKMASDAVKNYKKGDDAVYYEKLLLLGDLYTKHYPLDWNVLHQEEKACRLASLPSYPFITERHWVEVDSHVPEALSLVASQSPTTSLDGYQDTLHYLRNIFSENLKISSHKIDADVTYEVYGVESLSSLDIIRRMEKEFGELPKTLLYEKSTLRELAQYLEKKYPAVLEKLIMPQKIKVSYEAPLVSMKSFDHPNDAIEKNEDIAIIGLHGVYPMAKNLQEFWENLAKGRDCVSQVPEDRWNYKEYPVEVNGQKKYYNHGGFLEDVDKFDPLFFNIAPREAALMDPQERLFMQSAWSVLEDAGYTREHLRKTVNNEVGVFAGVTYHFYPLYIAEEWQRGNRLPLDIQLFSIANRVSYFLGLSGPSLVVDTACSSSLAAIHLACESILRGECQMAIAGGVNLSLHPTKYHALGSYHFLSDEGKCASFGAKGTGYVPGEGVGNVLLKRISLAKKEGDFIYGVIKGSHMNHGGKTSGYTVPNPNAQTRLIQSVLRKTNIHPRTVSYLEAHGTGTALGDPIEIRGLQEAFEEFTQDKQFCAMGSVKSNIGHLESAAGISQLTKVLLQLKHKKIAPSLHSTVLNPYIDFSQTPFVVQQMLSDWKTTENQPRRAGISSFGAGGANVHLIVEEYVADEKSEKTTIKQSYLFLLSAMNEERLYEYAKNMHDFLKRESGGSAAEALNNICYTSQVGREAMEVRLSVVVSSDEELIQKLHAYLERRSVTRMRVGKIKEGYHLEPEIIADAIQKEDLEKLAEYWVSGMKIEWETLYTGKKPQRVPLAVYPFEKRRCWVGSSSFSSPSPEKKEQESHEGLYTIQWEINALDKKSFSEDSSHWLIMSDSELGLHLQNTVGASQCTYCFSGSQYEKWSENVFYINPLSAEQYERVFSELHEKHKGRIAGVIFLNSFVDKTEEVLRSLFIFFQSIIKQKWVSPVKMVWVTRLAQCIDESDKVDPWQHAAGPMVRIFSAENPDYSVLSLDLDGKKQLSVDAARIVNEIRQLKPEENHIAYRKNERYVMRLRQYDSPYSSQWQVPLAAIITGGLGALGSELAHFLAKEGTRYLLLTGTTVLPERSEWPHITDTLLKEKIDIILSLEKMNVTVEYATVDIANKVLMQAVIQKTESLWNEVIDGVFHLAGVTTDNVPFEKMTEKLFQQVISVKAEGALVLHALFEKRALNCFVLFSSISALPYFGIGGLSAYATANAFLDGLAFYRRQLGLCALSVNWAAFSEKGMSFKYNHTAFLEAIGMSSLSIERSLPLLKRVMNGPAAVVPIFDVSWETFLRINHDAKKLQFFSYFVKNSTSSNKRVFEKKILFDDVLARLTQMLSQLLQMEITELDPLMEFQRYGMDSIIGVQFVGKISEPYPDVVSPMDLYRYSTLQALSEFIVKACQSHSSMDAEEETFMAAVSELDSEDIKKLIEKELTELEEDGI